MRLHLATICAALLTACTGARSRPPVPGDGAVTTERRERLPPFDAVQLSGALDLAVRVGAPQAVSVTIDRDLQQLVQVRVEDAVLVVRTDESLRGARRAVVEVSLPTLRRVALRGAGSVRIEGGSGPLELGLSGAGAVRWSGEATALDAELDGSGSVRLDGRARSLRLRMNGSSDVDARELEVGDADVTVRGSGSVRWRGAGPPRPAAGPDRGDAAER